MTFVTVHCDDEIDRSKWIPINKIKMIDFNADGSDLVLADDGNCYVPRIHDNFFESIVRLNGGRTVTLEGVS